MPDADGVALICGIAALVQAIAAVIRSEVGHDASLPRPDSAGTGATDNLMPPSATMVGRSRCVHRGPCAGGALRALPFALVRSPRNILGKMKMHGWAGGGE